MKTLKQELIDFLKYIKEVHTDQYGNLQICAEGDELDPTPERIVDDYLKPSVTEDINEEENDIVLITITRPAYGSPDCWYNQYVGQSFRAFLVDENEEWVDDDTEYYKICNSEPVVKEVGIGSLYVCNVQGYIPDYDITEIKK